MNSDGCEYLEWEICASLVIHLSWFWLECPLLCSNDLSLSSKSTAAEVPMLAALLKNSEFERKSCVDEKSLWDICESMSSNIGGDGGAIWRDLDEALNRGLQDDNQTVNQRSSFEQKRLLVIWTFLETSLFPPLSMGCIKNAKISSSHFL